MSEEAAAVENPIQVEPGLYRGIDFDAYTEWDAVNASTLNGFSSTPAHVYYEMQHGGKERTPALDLGWYVHLAVLEPDKWDSDIVIPPKVDRRTKAGKATWAQFEAENAEKQFVDQATYDKVRAMADSIRNHETAGEFFGGKGHNEVSILWEDKKAGVRCKARIDRIGTIAEWPIVGDLKTARNAGRRDFERSIYTYGYDVQAVHYLTGIEELYPIPDGAPFRRFVFFVVESEPPYLCACYELDDIALQEGELKRKKYLRTWRQCVESGEWPGYGGGVDYASLPPWALKNYETE